MLRADGNWSFRFQFPIQIGKTVTSWGKKKKRIILWIHLNLRTATWLRSTLRVGRRPHCSTHWALSDSLASTKNKRDRSCWSWTTCYFSNHLLPVVGRGGGKPKICPSSLSLKGDDEVLLFSVERVKWMRKISSF